MKSGAKPYMKISLNIQADLRLTRGLLILLMGAILIAPCVRADIGEQQEKREANFETADANGDGALTQAEFKAFVDANADDNLGRAAQLKRFGAYDRAFDRLDRDKSGTVTWSEVMDGLAEAS